jgi:hypothetical protein
MNPTNQAVIVIQKPSNWFLGGARSFIVSIDGRRAGKVARGMSGGFTVEPGEHALAISMDWFRSRPFQVVVEPGSRTELAIGVRTGAVLKMFVPMFVAALAAPLLIEGLRATTAIVDLNWWLRSVLFLIAYVVLFGGFVLVTSKLAGDYWELFTLGPAGTGTSKEPIGGQRAAAGDSAVSS